MFKPMTITHRENGDHGNRQKDSGNTRQFSTRQNRNDHGQGMQVDAVSNQAGIDDVIFDEAQHNEEKKYEQRRADSGMQKRHKGYEHCHNQWSNQGNKFAQPGNQSQHDWVG